MTVYSARADGVVLPSAELIEQYRAEGLWGDVLLPEHVLRWASREPHAVAIACDERRISYRQLAECAETALGRLRSAGLRRHDRVLVQLPNGTDLIITLIALIRAGIRPVLCPASLREREISYVAEQARPRGYVLHAPVSSGYTLQYARQLRASQQGLEHLFVLGNVPLADGETDLGALYRPGTAGPAAADGADRPDDVALYLLSSGTTGLPKPIPRTHCDYICNMNACAEVCRVDRQTVYLATLPIMHQFTLGNPGVLGTLAAGGRVVIGRPDPVEDVLDLIERERVTLTALVPSLAIKAAAAARAGRWDLSRLHVVQVGGARLPARDADQIRDALGGQVQQVYGMSEGVIHFTRLDDPWEVIRATQGRAVCAADEWRIVDDAGQDVPPGAIGELLVRGPYTIGGYLAPPSVSEKVFDSDGFYHTGDAVRLHPSGNLVVEGRVRDFVNVSGEKVSAMELEELLRGHPAVADCAVVPRPDPMSGEAVCLYAVVRDGAELTLRDVRTFLNRAGVARFKLPERLETVPALPLTPLGKLDRSALRRDAADSGQDRVAQTN